jgi:hypothetical protein
VSSRSSVPRLGRHEALDRFAQVDAATDDPAEDAAR